MLKSEKMYAFFDKRGYPASVVQAGHHRARLINRPSALQTSQKELSDFLVRSALQRSDQPELLNGRAHEAKRVLSFVTLRKYRYPSE